MADPLFPDTELPKEQGHTKPARSLFADEEPSQDPASSGIRPSVVAPLFADTPAPKPAHPSVPKAATPLFSESAPKAPPVPEVQVPNPLFATPDLSAPPAAPSDPSALPTASPLSFPERPLPAAKEKTAPTMPVLPATDLTEPPRSTVPVQPTTAFAQPEDPLAEKAMDLLLSAYPQASASQKAHWKAVLAKLFPLTADGIATLGQSAVRHAPQVLQEIARETKTFANLNIAAKVQKIADEAKASQQRPKKGLGGLLSKVEGAIHPFDEQHAQVEIIGLASALQGMSGRSRPVRELAQTVLEQLQDDLPILVALQQMAQGTSSEPWVSRRQDLLLASVQQLRMAQQQIENLENQIQAARASLDELRTITLPALGFLTAIQS